MPRKTEYVVRVVLSPRQREGEIYCMISECFRYAGLVSIISDTEDRFAFDIRCPNPKELDSKIWSEQNAARMKSFGYNAVSAPKNG